MNILGIVLAFFSIMLASGCATYQAVTIMTNPPNADIYIDNNYKGKAPLTERLLTDAFAATDANKRHVIIAKIDGYNDEISVLQSPVIS